MCENIQSDAVEVTRDEDATVSNAPEPPRHTSLSKPLLSCLTLPSTCFNNTVWLYVTTWCSLRKCTWQINTMSGMCCLFLTCNADFFCNMIHILSHYSVHLLSLSLFCDRQWIKILSMVCIYKIFFKAPPEMFHEKTPPPPQILPVWWWCHPGIDFSLRYYKNHWKGELWASKPYWLKLYSLFGTL